MLLAGTLGLRGGAGLPAVFHHSPPPLKDPQKLRLLHIPAHSSPGRRCSEGLLLHFVLVCRVDGDAWKTQRSVVASAYQWEFPQRCFLCIYFFLPAFPLVPWWLISCFRPTAPARTMSGMAEREWRPVNDKENQAGRGDWPSTSCRPPASKDRKIRRCREAKRLFSPHNVCRPSLHTCFLLTGFKTMPFLILSIISSTAFALMSGAEGGNTPVRAWNTQASPFSLDGLPAQNIRFKKENNEDKWKVVYVKFQWGLCNGSRLQTLHH